MFYIYYKYLLSIPFSFCHSF